MADEEKVQPKAKRERPQEPSPEQRKKLAKKNAESLRKRKGGYAVDPSKVFTIKNVVRRVQTRLLRAAGPGRLRFKQYIGGRRLLRNQKMHLTSEQLEKVQEDVLRGLKAGAFEMTDPDGWTYFVDATGELAKRRGGEIQTMKGEVKKAAPKPKEPEVEEVEEPEATEPETTEVEEPEEPEAVEPDDLTELPGVGAGRAKKLEAAGVTTFKQIAEMPPGDLVKVLGSPVTEDQAADICDAASEKEG